jgi:hypothetical protein
MKNITELEADFGVIRAIEKKIKKSFPHHEEIGGLVFTNHFELWYENPTFTCGDYNEACVIPQPRWAKFEVVNGKWFILESGDYGHREEEMLNVLIGVFGGERG